ncbi:hypothetical protein ACP3VS_24715, partial [Lysinibacillus sp. VIII_CA]
MADAFTVRSDLERAAQVLSEAKERIGFNKEIDRRLKLLTKRLESDFMTATTEAAPAQEPTPTAPVVRSQA